MVESFAFFTDPHVMGFGDDSRNETKMENYFKRVQKVYNSTPCSFLVCGGDWLNNSTTMDEACYRLGYLKGITNHMLSRCYLVKGNHDTNYQGKLDSESANNTGRLTDATIDAIMYRDTNTKKAYFSFDGANSKCYVLDSGIEHNTMLAYDWEQVNWLAQQLIADDPDRATIFLHIIISSDAVQTNASNFGTLVQAYNSHATVELNGTTYDFTGCSGHVDFWVAGHTHRDSTGVLGGIPYFITSTNSFNSDVPLIDLVLVDYTNREIKLVRVGGTGEDRTISLDVT
jgi:predicted phosphodiesterase